MDLNLFGLGLEKSTIMTQLVIILDLREVVLIALLLKHVDRSINRWN